MLTIGAAIALFSGAATQAPVEEQQFEIQVTYETRLEGEDGSSGSSRGRSLYVEQHLPDREGCTRRLFDAIDSPGRTRPLADWKLPVIVRRCGDSSLEIENGDELLARLETFLDAAGLTREACGQYYFTWNLFQIDCEPAEILGLVNDLNLSAVDLTEGARFELPDGQGTAILSRNTRQENGTTTFSGSGPIGPGVLREQAATTIIIRELIDGNEVSLEDAQAQLDNLEFGGTFLVEFEIDQATGTITRTVTQDSFQIDATGTRESRWSKVVTQRKRAEPNGGPDPSD